ncbi:MAG: hypothetical protein RSA10_01835 [Bacilli bacterium]
MKNKGINGESSKKITAALVAGALTISGIGALISHNKKGTDNTDDVQITDTVKLENEKFIWSEFDINVNEEVLARATAMYEISDKTVSVEEIIDIIYLINERPELIKKASLKYAQKMMLDVEKLLRTNIDKVEVNNVINNDLNFIYTHYFIAKDYKDRDKALEYDKLVSLFLEKVQLGNVEEKKETSNLIRDMLTNLYSNDLSSGVGYLISVDKTKFTFNNTFLDMTKEQRIEFDKNTQNIYDSLLSGNYIKVKKITKDEEIDKGCEKVEKQVPNDAKNIKNDTKTNEKTFNSKTDEKVAEEKIGEKAKIPETLPSRIEVDPGGKPVGTETVTKGGESINESTTIEIYDDEIYYSDEDALLQNKYESTTGETTALQKQYELTTGETTASQKQYESTTIEIYDDETCYSDEITSLQKQYESTTIEANEDEIVYVDKDVTKIEKVKTLK